MNTQATTVEESLALTQNHYENFPVASWFLPKALREPIAVIYQFARQADDFADEGDLSIDERLTLLQGFENDLDFLVAYIKPDNPFLIYSNQSSKSINCLTIRFMLCCQHSNKM